MKLGLSNSRLRPLRCAEGSQPGLVARLQGDLDGYFRSGVVPLHIPESVLSCEDALDALDLRLVSYDAGSHAQLLILHRELHLPALLDFLKPLRPETIHGKKLDAPAFNGEPHGDGPRLPVLAPHEADLNLVLA